MRGLQRQAQRQVNGDTRYELVTHLANGGMAELYVARRRGRGGEEYMVLKRILPAHARNPHFVTMFLDEARVSAHLNHPNIARVKDVGRTGDTYFYTMEYVHGENARELLRRAHAGGVRIPPAVAVSIIAAAAAGLHAAHEQRDRDGRPLGIVHRDVSPSNVMLGYDGAVKVVDFGIAKAADRMTETRSGAVKGKIAYLSPEQCRLQPVDRRSDVFALGIVAWELLAQRRLFRQESDYDAMHAIVSGVIEPPSAAKNDVPPWLDAVVRRALERDPARRPPTAADVAIALLDGARSAGWEVGAPVVAAFMARLFGSRPLPWLDPALVDDEPATDVVSLGSIDASLIVGSDGSDPAPATAAAPAEPAVAAAPVVVAPVVAPAPASAPGRMPVAAVAPAPASAPGRMPVAAVAPAPASPMRTPELPAAASATPPPIASVADAWPTTPLRAATVPPAASRRRLIGPAALAFAALLATATIAAAIIAAPEPVEPAPPPRAVAAAAAGTAPAAEAETETAPETGTETEAETETETETGTETEPGPAQPIPPIELRGAAKIPNDPAPLRPMNLSPSGSGRNYGREARGAARSGRWREAGEACKEGLRERPGDREMTKICALAACHLGQAAVARHHMARLSEEQARLATKACVSSGTFTSARECIDDPSLCR